MAGTSDRAGRNASSISPVVMAQRGRALSRMDWSRWRLRLGLSTLGGGAGTMMAPARTHPKKAWMNSSPGGKSRSTRSPRTGPSMAATAQDDWYSSP